MRDTSGRLGKSAAASGGQNKGTMSNANKSSPSSPLLSFGEAKRNINAIFADLLQYSNNCVHFLTDANSVRRPNSRLTDTTAKRHDSGPTQSEIISEAEVHSLVSINEQIQDIKHVLERDHMKVVFFGRTSNGKSTVINSLLGDNILPTGIGHTTSCFLQIEGAPDNDSEAPYIYTEDAPSTRQSIDSLAELGHALCAAKLSPDSQVRIVWPKSKCRMLAAEVVLIDSPGVDVEADLDEWIDKFCLDADVFVLVANAESTLMLAEKKFFHRVSERLSNPNVFIVHNRSDAFAGESRATEVREQHMSRAVNFLTEELQLCSAEDARNDCVFFISAKEALRARMQEAVGQPPSIATEDFFPRYLEFGNFEKKLSTSLSQTAVNTKFNAHTVKGVAICASINAILTSTLDKATETVNRYATVHDQKGDQLRFIRDQLRLRSLEVRDSIKALSDDVEFKVSRAMSEEICRLAVLVDEFSSDVTSNYTPASLYYPNGPGVAEGGGKLNNANRQQTVQKQRFNPDDAMAVRTFKQALSAFIEQRLGLNLRGRLSGGLQLDVETYRRDMIEYIATLIPEDESHDSRRYLARDLLRPAATAPETAAVVGATCGASAAEPAHPSVQQASFEILYHFNCDNLAADFEPQLDFSFSFSPSLIIRRLIATAASTTVNTSARSMMPSRAIDSTTTLQTNMAMPIDVDVLSRVAHATGLAQHASMLSLVAGGVLIKSIGWRLLLGSICLYSALYAYERLTWTVETRRRLFNRQYVEHVTRKLRLIVDMTSASCSHQVQQELTSTYVQLIRLVEDTSTDIDNELQSIDVRAAALRNTIAEVKSLRNESAFIVSKFNLFRQSFLSSAVAAVNSTSS